MSKRNSKEAKRLRRELKAKLAERRYAEDMRNIESVPMPDEYIKHRGHIPNIPFFQNCAFAVHSKEMKLALRTKKQLVDYVENNPDKQVVGSKTGNSMIRISFVYPISKKEIFQDGLGNYSWKPTRDENGAPYQPLKKGEDNSQQLYQVIHCISENMGEKGEENLDVWKRNNPFYSNSNSIFLNLEDVHKLPEKRLTRDELIYFAKADEALTPMDEEEIENFLSTYKESDLKEHYEHYKGQLVIDEFSGIDGETLYQPRKTDLSWAYSIFNAPLVNQSTYFSILTPEIVEGKTKSKHIKQELI